MERIIQDGIGEIGSLVGRSIIAPVGAGQTSSSYALPVLHVNLRVTGASATCCADCGTELVEPQLTVDSPHEAEERRDGDCVYVVLRQLAALRCRECGATVLRVMTELNCEPK